MRQTLYFQKVCGFFRVSLILTELLAREFIEVRKKNSLFSSSLFWVQMAPQTTDHILSGTTRTVLIRAFQKCILLLVYLQNCSIYNGFSVKKCHFCKNMIKMTPGPWSEMHLGIIIQQTQFVCCQMYDLSLKQAIIPVFTVLGSVSMSCLSF